MGPSFWQLLIVVVIILIVFGAGKIPQVLGDLGKGMKNLRDNMESKEDKPTPKVTAAKPASSEKPAAKKRTAAKKAGGSTKKKTASKAKKANKTTA